MRAAHAAGLTAGLPSPLPTPPAALLALLQQAVQQALAAHATSTASAHGQAPNTPPPVPPHHGVANGAPEPGDQQTGCCSIPQVQMAQKRKARGTWDSHWLRGEQQHCQGRRNGHRPRGGAA